MHNAASTDGVACRTRSMGNASGSPPPSGTSWTGAILVATVAVSTLVATTVVASTIVACTTRAPNLFVATFARGGTRSTIDATRTGCP